MIKQKKLLMELIKEEEINHQKISPQINYEKKMFEKLVKITRIPYG